MFSDELLEKIFADEEVRLCPIGTQSTIIHAIERIFEEEGVVIDDTKLSSDAR